MAGNLFSGADEYWLNLKKWLFFLFLFAKNIVSLQRESWAVPIRGASRLWLTYFNNERFCFILH